VKLITWISLAFIAGYLYANEAGVLFVAGAILLLASGFFWCLGLFGLFVYNEYSFLEAIKSLSPVEILGCFGLTFTTVIAIILLTAANQSPPGWEVAQALMHYVGRS
jgi:hypothetical protein